jgi:predicted nucleotidyltransferase
MRTPRRARKPPAHAAPLLRECKRIIQRFLPDATVILYGSLARGTAGPESDWDLLILTDKRLTSAEERQVSDAIYDLELEHGVVISDLLRTRDEWDTPVLRGSPLRESIEREGIVI